MVDCGEDLGGCDDGVGRSHDVGVIVAVAVGCVVVVM